MPLPPLISGARFRPTPIRKYCIEDLVSGMYFSGWQDVGPMLQICAWSDNPRLRWEVDTAEEARIEAALIINEGCAGNRAIEVCSRLLS